MDKLNAKIIINSYPCTITGGVEIKGFDHIYRISMWYKIYHLCLILQLSILYNSTKINLHSLSSIQEALTKSPRYIKQIKSTQKKIGKT